MSSNILDHLEKRDFIANLTSHEIKEIVNHPVKVYVGFDPTAPSLHLGNLMGIIALAWFSRFGHTPVVLIGGATAMIGDPSGKSAERQLLDNETISKNSQSIEKCLRGIFKHAKCEIEPIFLNNYDWLSSFSFIEFLRDVGKHFRLSSMLAKDSVKSRLSSEEGISFTEFSYQLLQGYDFLHLWREFGVEIQMGGSDQWGNITAGLELVRKAQGASVHGITFPLLTRSDGKKFGKSETGAIWLNEELLSAYEFYQYLFRLPDSDAIRLMQMLTFMPLEEIRVIEREMKSSTYHPNSAQRRLAEEVTRIVHGEHGLKLAQSVTQAALPGQKTLLELEQLEMMALEMGSHKLCAAEVIGKELSELFVKVELASSKSEARRLIEGSGAYMNNEKLDNIHQRLESKDLVYERFLLLAVGKKKKKLIEVKS